MKELREFFQFTRNQFGDAIWNEPDRLKAVYRDIAPEQQKEQRLVESMSRSGALQIMAASLSADPTDREQAFLRAADQVRQMTFCPETTAREACADFYEACGVSGSELQGNRPANRNMTPVCPPAQQSIPAASPVSSVPIDPPVLPQTNFIQPVQIPVLAVKTKAPERKSKKKAPIILAAAAILCALVAIYILQGGLDRTKGQNEQVPVEIRELFRSPMDTEQIFLNGDDREYLLYPARELSESNYILDLNQKYDCLRFQYAINYQTGATDRIRLSVYTDGLLLYQTAFAETETNGEMELDVSGASEIRFMVDCDGELQNNGRSYVRLTNAYVSNAAWDQCLYDDATVIKTKEKRGIEKSLQEIRNKYGIDVMIITAKTDKAGAFETYANAFYSRHRQGYYSDRIIIVLLFDTDWWTSPTVWKYLKGNVFCSGSQAETVRDLFRNEGEEILFRELNDLDYTAAVQRAISNIRKICESEADGEVIDFQ